MYGPKIFWDATAEIAAADTTTPNWNIIFV